MISAFNDIGPPPGLRLEHAGLVVESPIFGLVALNVTCRLLPLLPENCVFCCLATFSTWVKTPSAALPERDIVDANLEREIQGSNNAQCHPSI